MKNRKKGLWILIIIIVVLFSLNPETIKYLQAKTNADAEAVSIAKEIETPHSSQIIYEKLDNGIIKYWEGILIYYNMIGEQVWSVNLGITRPVIKTNSNNVYVIDEKQSQIYSINKKGEQVYKKTLDKSFSNINICEDNYVALLHSADGPIRYVTILNEKGENAGEIVLGEGEITNLAISKVYDRIALSTIGISGGKLDNKLLIYDLKGNLLSTMGLKNNIILDVFLNEKGELIVADEKNIFSINKNNEQKWEVNLVDPIRYVHKSGAGFFTIYSEGRGKNNIIYSRGASKIQTFGYNGRKAGETNLEEDILGIDSIKNDIISYSLRTIYKHNKNGDIKFEYKHTSDILKSFVLSEENIVVITKEKTTFLSTK